MKAILFSSMALMISGSSFSELSASKTLELEVGIRHLVLVVMRVLVLFLVIRVLYFRKAV